MVNALGKMPLFSKPIETPRPETTGVLASRSTGVSSDISIFGSASSTAETSGSCAFGGSSDGGGGCTLAIA